MIYCYRIQQFLSKNTCCSLVFFTDCVFQYRTIQILVEFDVTLFLNHALGIMLIGTSAPMGRKKVTCISANQSFLWSYLSTADGDLRNRIGLVNPMLASFLVALVENYAVQQVGA